MFFTSIGDMIEKIFDLVQLSASSALMNELYVLVSISITILIMYKGFQVLAGKVKAPLVDIVWDIAVKMIIISFAMNFDNWLTFVIEAMNGLNEWAGGGTNLYSTLDTLFAKTRELADIAYEKGSWGGGVVALILVYLGFLIGALPALILIITTSFTLKVLIMVAPFMIFALFYGWLKNMFTQWLSLFFSNTLTVLIISLVFSAIITKFNAFIAYSASGLNGGIDPFYIGFQVIIVGILLSVIVAISWGFAEKIATVSMESVMQSGFGKQLDPAKKYLEHQRLKRLYRGK